MLVFDWFCSLTVLDQDFFEELARYMLKCPWSIDLDSERHGGFCYVLSIPYRFLLAWAISAVVIQDYNAIHNGPLHQECGE
jgi:hypothetical protein